jgi:phosphoglucomutase/phosphomannomutase
MGNSLSTAEALAAIKTAAAEERISPTAAKNITLWLTEARYAEYTPQVLAHIAEKKWKALDDAFWTVIPFGTAGRRGTMYPVGCNAINDRTMGESAQGLANYFLRHVPVGETARAAVAYDTRHRSRDFAELCAEILVAAGHTVYFLDGHRSTPELAFTTRSQRCQLGIMISASHNPPADNAIKAFDISGGQLRPPHDAGVMECVAAVQEIQRANFQQACAAGKIIYCQAEMDGAYRAAVLKSSRPGPRDLKILYSPLHGVGLTSVLPVLKADGFSQVEVFALHAEPSGDFPNVPGHIANPENAAVFIDPIARAQQSGAELVLATDPDADRLGAAAPLYQGGPWLAFTGNQIGVLLANDLLERLKANHQLTSQHFLVKTLVTSEMIRRLGDHFGVRTFGDVLTGFKWIGAQIDEHGSEHFVFGYEEAHGYLAGSYIRDKDGALAAMLLAETAATAKAQGQTLHEKLAKLYKLVGYHAEKPVAITLPGADGMAKMQAAMKKLRTTPPASLANIRVKQMRDYQSDARTLADGQVEKLTGPSSDLIFIDLEREGFYVGVRPSGTEPKLKIYTFGYVPPAECGNLAQTAASVDAILSQFAAELQAFVT